MNHDLTPAEADAAVTIAAHLAARDVVMISAVRRYPAADITDNNQADAVILAAIGARLAGHPIDDPLPMANQTALTKLPRITDAA